MYNPKLFAPGFLTFCFISLLAAVNVNAPAPASSDGLPVRHRSILAALERRDYPAVERELRTLQTAEPDAFRVNNYEYLLGRIAEKRGDWPAAGKSYAAVIDQGSILSEYARWHLARIARQQKDLRLEREQIKHLLDDYPESLLADQARLRLAENYLESGDTAAALPIFRARANSTTATGREALGRVGLAYLKLGQEQAARAVFEKLLSGARDDQALLAAQKLDELDSRARLSLSEADLLARARLYLYNRDTAAARAAYQQILDRFPESRARPEALYSIGRSYFLEYDYTNAIKWYDRVHAEFPASSQGELGFYHAGHAYQNLGRYQEAVARYQQVIDEYPRSEWLGGAHLNTIDSLRSAGKFEEALDWCQRTIKRFNHEVTGTTALFDQAKIYLIKGDYAQALDTFNELRMRNLSQRAPGATNRAEVDFMRAFCLEKLGRIAEAIDAYLAFPVDRNSYYSNRATLRLEELAREVGGKAALAAKFKLYLESSRRELAAGNIEAAKASANQALRLTTDAKAEAELVDILRGCYSKLPQYNRFFSFTLEPAGRSPLAERSRTAQERSHRALADELIFLGLYDEGAPELQASMATGDLDARLMESGSELPPAAVGDGTDGDGQSELVDVAERHRKQRAGNSLRAPSSSWQYSLAVYLNRGSHAYPALRYGESTFAGLPNDFRLELLPRDIAELLYPAPYRDELSAEARSRGVDTRFMLAIARQESRFDPSAKSGSAARGLFQFIPATAERIREELKLANLSQSDLYSPTVAISFAAQYMNDLFSEFKENPYAVAASYNGSEMAARRWMERARSSDIDRFVIEIAYQESKDYVYKVMDNYWAYRQLYREDLTTR